jgi:hypothetical protein
MYLLFLINIVSIWICNPQYLYFIIIIIVIITSV